MARAHPAGRVISVRGNVVTPGWVTTFIDAGNYHAHLTADVVGQAGMRCVVARSSFDVTRSAMGAALRGNAAPA